MFGAYVNITNSIFANSTNYKLYINMVGVLNITNSIFENINYTGGEGATAITRYGKGDTFITNSTFNNITTSYSWGGSVNGGVIITSSSGTLHIDNSIFTNNLIELSYQERYRDNNSGKWGAWSDWAKYPSYGSVIFSDNVYSQILINNSKFFNNGFSNKYTRESTTSRQWQVQDLAGYGSSIYSRSNVTVINTSFINGKGANYEIYINSNHISDANIKIIDSIFNNTVGAIYFYNSSGITITNSNFTNLKTNSIVGNNVSGDINISNSIFKNIAGSISIGYIFNGSIFIEFSNFESLTTVFYTMGGSFNFTVLNSTFKNLYRGIYAYSVRNVTSIINSIFKNINYNGGEWAGGFTRAYGAGNTHIINSSFTNITNSEPNGYDVVGSAVYISGSGNLFVENSIFTNNTIGTSYKERYRTYSNNKWSSWSDWTEHINKGVAIYFSGYGAIYVDNSKFIDNSFYNTFNKQNTSTTQYDIQLMGGYGSSIFSSGNLSIINSIISNGNNSEYSIYINSIVRGGNLNIINSTFSNDGGIYSYNSSAVNIINSNLTNLKNNAITSGNVSGNINISNSIFKNIKGYGILTNNVSREVFINNSIFNSISNLGICVNGFINSSLGIFNSNFTNTNGGIYVFNVINGTVSVLNSNFINQSYTALFLRSNIYGNVDVLNNDFLNINAEIYGAILLRTNGKVNISNNDFINISMVDSAINLMVVSNNISIVNSTFANIQSKVINKDYENFIGSNFRGGALYFSGSGAILIKDSTFDNIQLLNSYSYRTNYGGSWSSWYNCPAYGGVIYNVLNGNLTIINSNFTDNGIINNLSSFTGYYEYQVNTINGDGGSIYSTYPVTILNSNFDNLKGDYSYDIYVKNSVNIYNSTFNGKNNGILYIGNGSSIVNGNLLNNGSVSNTVGGDINGNWWGENSPVWGSRVIGGSARWPETWIVLSFINTSSIASSGSSTLLVGLDNVFNKTDLSLSHLDDVAFSRNVTFDSVGLSDASFTNNGVNFNENITSTLTHSSLDNYWLISATVDKQTLYLGPATLTVNVSVSEDSVRMLDSVTYTISVSSLSNFTNFTVFFDNDFTLLSSVGVGVYNESSGIWNLGDIGVGNYSLNITVRVPFNQSLVGKNVSSSVNFTGVGLFNYGEVFTGNVSKDVLVLGMSGGSYTDLQRIIDGTPDGEVVDLAFNVTYNASVDKWLIGGIKLNKTLTLNGNGYTINGLDTARIFYITASDVVVNDLILTNATARPIITSSYISGSIIWYFYNFTHYGGAVYADVNGNLSFVNCNFTNNKLIVGLADEYIGYSAGHQSYYEFRDRGFGAGIFSINPNSTLNLINSYFDNNTFYKNATNFYTYSNNFLDTIYVRVDALGSAVYTNGSLNIINTSFNNSALGNDVVRVGYGSNLSVNIINSTFSNIKGMGFVSSSNLSDLIVINSVFDGVSSWSISSNIVQNDLIILESNFTNGVGVFSTNVLGNVTVKDSIFDNIKTSALYFSNIKNNANIFNNNFSNFYSEVYNYASVLINVIGGDVNIVNSNFVNMTINYSNRGAIRINTPSGDVNVINSSFINIDALGVLDNVNSNYGFEPALGGAIAVTGGGIGGNFTIDGSYFENVHITSSYQYYDNVGGPYSILARGGVIFSSIGGGLTIVNSYFVNNSIYNNFTTYSANGYDYNIFNLTGQGGSIYVRFNLNIYNSTFEDVRGNYNYDIYSEGNVDIKDSVFVGNSTGLLFIGNSSNSLVRGNAFIGGSVSNTVGANINGNWWGENSPVWGSRVLGGSARWPETWIVMGFANLTSINSGSSPSTLLVSLDTVYNKSSEEFTKLDSVYLNRTVVFDSENIAGVSFTNNNSGFIVNTTSEMSFSSISGDWLVSATVDKQTLYLGPGSIRVNITVNNNTVPLLGLVTYTVTVSALSNFTNVEVYVNNSFWYMGQKGDGYYNSSSNIWFVGNVSNDINKTINITFCVPYNLSLVGLNVSTDASVTAISDYNYMDVVSSGSSVNVTILNKTGTGSYTELQRIIDNTPENSVIDLMFNVTYNKTTDAWLINGMRLNKSNITINGHGYTINGLNTARIFIVTNVSTLKGLIMTNASNGADGEQGYGGAINTRANLTIIDSILKDNRVQSYVYGSSYRSGGTGSWPAYTYSYFNGYGAAIFSSISSNSLTIINTTFINNTKFYNVNVPSDTTTWRYDVKIGQINGSSIFTHANLTIINSTFDNNCGDGYDVWADNVNLITGSIFNGKNSGLLYVGNSNKTVNLNVFLNGKVYNNGSNFDDNWWGVNDPKWNSMFSGVRPETWVLMNWTLFMYDNRSGIVYNSSIDLLNINNTNGSSIILRATLDTVYNRTNGTYQGLNGSIPSRIVYYNTWNGTLNHTITDISVVDFVNFTYGDNTTWVELNATIDNQVLTLRIAHLSPNLTKVNTPHIGSNFTVTIRIDNIGNTSVNYAPGYDGAVFNFTLPDFVEYVGFKGDGVYYNDSGLWYMGNITNGTSRSINITMFIPYNQSLIGKVMVFRSPLLWGHFLTDLGDGIIEIPPLVVVIEDKMFEMDLSISKSISNPTPKYNESVIFNITVTNNGPDFARNVVVTDFLENMIYNGYTATNGSFNGTHWTIGTINFGEIVSLLIYANLNVSGNHSNFASVYSLSDNDTDMSNNVANVSFVVPDLSDIGVNITVAPQVDNYVNVTVVVWNTGPDDALNTAVRVNLSSYLSEVSWNTGDIGSYDDTNHVWTIGLLPANTTYVLSIYTHVSLPTNVLIQNITLTASISSASTDSNISNNFDNVTFEAVFYDSFTELQRLVDATPAGGVLVLPRSYSFNPNVDGYGNSYFYPGFENGVMLNKSITILNPMGYTLSGNNLARIFNITANNVYLYDLTFTAGYSYYGGAVYIEGSYVNITRSTFVRNEVFGDWGGAVYVKGNYWSRGVHVNIFDNVFEWNEASKFGGALTSINAYYLSVYNNTFINNSVSSSLEFGGAVAIKNGYGGKGVVGNVFLDNFVSGPVKLGSAIHTDGSISIEGNWFGNNTPNMVNNTLIYGSKPNTYIIFDWGNISNPNMNNVTLEALFYTYNRISGVKTPLSTGIVYRTISFDANAPTIGNYSNVFTGDTSVVYSYDLDEPVYRFNATVDYQTISLEWSTFLTILKNVSNSSLYAGDELVFNITVVNYGPHNSSTLNVYDVLPAYLNITSINGIGVYSFVNNTNLTWNFTAPAGENTSLIINTTPLKEGNYVNNVTVNNTSIYDYFLWKNSTYANASVKYNVITACDISINVTLSEGPYYEGGTITYTVTVHNNGPTSASSVLAYIPPVSGLSHLSHTGGTYYTYLSPVWHWNVGTLAVNQTKVLNITWSIGRTGEFNQTTSLTTSTYDRNMSNNYLNFTFNVTTLVDLNITVSINKDNISLYGDDGIIVTVRLVNNGPSKATNVTVNTNWTGLTLLSNTTTQGYYNESVWYVGNLTKGTVRYLYLYYNATTLGLHNFTAYASGWDNDSNLTNNNATLNISIIEWVDLSIIKNVSNTTPYRYEYVNYTITVYNKGLFNATNITVVDILPASLIFNSSSDSSNFNGTHWNISKLNAGENITLNIRVWINGSGWISNTARVYNSTNDVDKNLNNNNYTILINARTGNDLLIVKNVSNTAPYRYEYVNYTISVYNNGIFNESNITVVDILDSRLVFINSSDSSNFNGTHWNISKLDIGKWVNLTVTVFINGSGVIKNTVSVNGLYTENDTNNNIASVDINITNAVDLSINKTVNNSIPFYGETILYTINVYNNGLFNEYNITVIDTLPDGLVYISSNDTNFNGTHWNISSLSVGESKTLEILALVNSTGNFTNTATVINSREENNTANNKASVTVNVPVSTDLGISIVSSTYTPTLYSTFTINITVVNNGPTNNTNITVDYILPAGLEYVNHTTSLNYTPSTGVWSISRLNMGENITLTITVNATLVDTINTTTNVSGFVIDHIPVNNSANLSVTVLPIFDLSIIKSPTGITIDDGEYLEYNITVTNNGPCNATNIIITDTLIDNVTYIWDNSSGVSSGNIVTWNFPTLAVGENITISLRVLPYHIGTTLSNTVKVQAYGVDLNNSDNTYTSVLNVRKVADLEIIITATPNTDVIIGDTVHFVITVINHGASNASAVKVFSLLDTSLFSNIVSNDTLHYTPSTGVWLIPGILALNDKVSLEINATILASGVINLTANVSANEHDSNLTNNNATVNISVLPMFDLCVEKIASNYSIDDGDIVTFTITVFNDGPGNATNVRIIDILPANTFFIAADSGGESNGNIVNWTISSLNVGENYTVSLMIRPYGVGNKLVNHVNVTARGKDSNLTNNEIDCIVNVTPISNLQVILSSNITNLNISGNITFYINVTNLGPDSNNGVNAYFKVPDGFVFLSASSMFYNNITGLWSIGNLAVNSSVLLEINATGLYPGDYIAFANVSGNVKDKNLDNNNDTLDVSIWTWAELSINASLNSTASTIDYGDIYNYTITVINHGPFNATKVNVNILLPGMIYISDNSTGEYNNTSGIWTIGNLTVNETISLTICLNASTVGVWNLVSTVKGFGREDNLSDNKNITEITIIENADIMILNITSNMTIIPMNSSFILNITVFNNGPGNATNINLSYIIPSSFTIVNMEDLIFNLSFNQTREIILYLNATNPGNYTLDFNLTFKGTDRNLTNNNGSINLSVVYYSDAMIRVSVSNPTPSIGDMIVYTVTVSNLDYWTSHGLNAYIDLPSLNLTYDHHYLSSGVYDPSTNIWTIGDLSWRNSTNLFIFARVNTLNTTTVNVNLTSTDYDFHLENNYDSVTINTKIGADLKISISVDDTNPSVAGEVTYTINIENIGLVNATGVKVKVNAPAGLIYKNSTDSWFVGANEWVVGNLNIGELKSINITYSPVLSGDLTLTATVSSTQSDYNLTNNNANITINSSIVTDLSININASSTNIMVGETVIFTITVTNKGYLPVSGANIYTGLPIGILTYIPPTNGFYIPYNSMWVAIDLDAGESANLIINYTYQNPGIYNVWANATSNTPDINPNNNYNNISINVDNYDDLVLNFTVINTTLINGEYLNITINIWNNGTHNHENIKVITDLPVTGTYTGSGLFDTKLGVWNVGNLTIDEVKSLNLLIKLNTTGTYTYWANASWNDGESDYTNNNRSINISVIGDYNLIVNINSQSIVELGENINFTITILNQGPSTAHDVSIIDNIYGNVVGISQGTYVLNTWNIGDIPANTLLTLNLSLNASYTGNMPLEGVNISYGVWVTSSDSNYERNLTDNTAYTNITLKNTIDLIATITSNVSTINSGETVEFTITVYNNASHSANMVIVTIDNLTEYTTYTTNILSFFTSNSWIIPTLNSKETAILKVNKTITKDTTVTVNASTSNNPELNPVDNIDNVSVGLNPSCDLVVNIVSNVSSVLYGDSVLFTVSVLNNGSTKADNVWVSVNLPYSLDYSVNWYDPLHGFWFIDSIGVGETVELNLTSKLTDVGLNVFVANVTGSTPDVNLSNNNASLEVFVGNSSDLSISVSSNSTVLNVGDSVNIIVTVLNNGPSVASDVNVSLNLPGLPYASVICTVDGVSSVIGLADVWSISTLTSSAVLNISYIVGSGDSGVYSVSVNCSAFDRDYSNNNDSLVLSVGEVVDLVVTVTQSGDVLNLTDSVIYTVNVLNNGVCNASGVNLTLDWGSDFVLGSTLPIGVLSGDVWCIGDLNVGGSATLILIGNFSAYGNYILNLTVNSTENDFNLSNNGVSVFTEVLSATNLRVNLTTTGVYNLDGTLSFIITVENIGVVDAENTVVSVGLPRSIKYAVSSGYYDFLTSKWYLGTVGVGGVQSLILNVSLNPGLNTLNAKVETSTFDIDYSNNYVGLNYTVNPSCDVGVNITVNNGTVGLDDEVVFIVTVWNGGPATAFDVLVKLDLPATISYDNGGVGVYDIGLQEWGIGNLTSGEVRSLNVTLRFNKIGNYTYNVSVSGNYNDTDSSNDNSSVSLFVSPVTDLGVNIILNSTNIFVGDNVTFLVSVYNVGFDTTGVILENFLPGGFVADNTSFNSPISIPSLANNTSISFNISGIIINSGSFNITSNVSSVLCENDYSNNVFTLNFDVDSLSDIGVNITVDKVNVLVGENVTYTITVTNYVSKVVSGVLVNTGILNGVCVKSVGFYDSSSGLYYMPLLGGNDMVSINITVPVLSEGNITINVSLDSQLKDNNTSNNNASVNITVNSSTDLSLSVVVDCVNPQLDDIVTYTVTVVNTGLSTAKDVNLSTDLILNEFNLISISGAFNPNNGLWTVGDILREEVKILTLSFKANKSGEFYNNFAVSTSTSEFNVSNNNVSSFINVITGGSGEYRDVVDLVINITNGLVNSTVWVNNTVNFTISVYNNANITAHNVSIVNSLPSDLTVLGAYGNWSSGVWNFTEIPAYSSVSVAFTVNATVLGSFVTNVTVNSSEWDNVSVNNQANSLVIVKEELDCIDLEVNVTREGILKVGELFNYTLIVSNYGPDIAYDVNCSMNLSSGLVVVGFNDTGFNNSTGIWSIGDLGINETVRMIVTVKISDYGSFTNFWSVWDDDVDLVPLNNNFVDNFNLESYVVDLNVRISVNESEPDYNSSVMFTVVVSNAGLLDAHNVSVNLSLPVGLVDLVSNDTGLQNGVLNIGNLSKMSSLSFTFNVTVNSTQDLIVGVNVSSDEEDSYLGDNVDSVIVSPVVPVVIDYVDLWVVVDTTSYKPVVGSDVPVLTIYYGNNGPSVARDVVVSFGVFGGVSIGSRSPGYIDAFGGWFISELSPGENGSFSVYLDVLNDSDVQFTGYISTSNVSVVDSCIFNNTCSIVLFPEMPVVVCDLGVNVTVDKTSLVVDGLVRFNITVWNNGTSVAENAVLYNLLPAGFMFVSGTGGYSSVVNGYMLGDLSPGMVRSFVVNAKSNLTGLVSTMVTVNSSTQDMDPMNNGVGIGLYVSDSSKDLVNVSTSVSFKIDLLAGQSLSGGKYNLMSSGLHVNASLLNSSGSGVSGQKLVLDIYKGNVLFKTVESDSFTDVNGFTTFTVPSSELVQGSSFTTYKLKVRFEGGSDTSFNYLDSGSGFTSAKIKA